MPVAPLGPTPIHYRLQGSGRPPLLLVHGAGGSSLHFAQLMGLLAPHMACVAPDLPGHGQSPAGERVAEADLLDHYVERLAELAESLGLGRFVLLGHSMGGAVAQLFALKYPDRLAGLVLMATAARLKVAPAVFETIRDHFEELPRLMEAVGYSPSTSPATVRSFCAAQLQAPREVVLADFRACALFDQRERVSAIRCPTTLLSAGDDRLTPPKLQAQLEQLIPRSRLVPLPRCGHFMFFERPEAVAEALVEAWDLAARGQAATGR